MFWRIMLKMSNSISKFPFKLPVLRFTACDYPLWYQTFLKIKTCFISHPTTGYLDNRCYRELRSYLRLRTFLTNNYFKWTKCFISFIFTTERVFYNSHLYSLYVGSLLQLCSFCFTANVPKNISATQTLNFNPTMQLSG
jgi:hypothetical protein